MTITIQMIIIIQNQENGEKSNLYDINIQEDLYS